MSETILAREFSLDVAKKFAEEGKLYAILDACDEPEVPSKVTALGDRATCLYRGVDDPKTLAIAPYLAHLDSSDVNWLAETLWGRFWGIFAIADSTLKAMRKHFRKFLTVDLEGQGPVYFRYYDPRVLETFLPTCNADQLTSFYGKIDAFGIFHPKLPGHLRLFTRA